MNEALKENPTDYESFNAFFARPLKENARPVGDCDYVFPSDGKLSAFGKINKKEMLQAKNHFYSLDSLLVDGALSQKMENGDYFTIYLSPKNYHRVHMPCQGKLKKMLHVHGNLYSVNPQTAENIPHLFAKNERLICHFEGENSDFVVVLVGATIVGSIFTQWAGVVAPPRTGFIRSWDYAEQNIVLKKGEEMGGFLMGSTVIVIFPEGTIKVVDSLQPNQTVQMGENFGGK